MPLVRVLSEMELSGIEIDVEYSELARKHCDRVYTLNIDDVPEYFWEMHLDIDCWIFGDTLEHLKDPWKVLSRINNILPNNGYIVACIPNMQHWSIQTKLSIGDLSYEDKGLLDRTHLRWFSKRTIIEMFENCGFKIIELRPRVFNENPNPEILRSIGGLAAFAGIDAQSAIIDSLPLQYVIKAISK